MHYFARISTWVITSIHNHLATTLFKHIKNPLPQNNYNHVTPGGDGQALVIAESANFSTLNYSVRYFSRKMICCKDLLCCTDSTRCMYRTGRTALPQPAPGFSVATAVMMFYDSTAVQISFYLVKFLL